MLISHRRACFTALSPWVCNCGHAWSDHHQETVVGRAIELPEMAAELASELDLNFRKDGSTEG